jgi:single-stranded-DNA-specific exonuclease
LAHATKRWIVQPAPHCDIEALARAIDVPPIVARILASRGLVDPASCKKFLNPSIAGLHSPHTLFGMVEAVSILREACASQTRICIYGDYDADG